MSTTQQPVYQYVTAPTPGNASVAAATPGSTAPATTEGFSTESAMKEAKKMSKEDIFLLCIAWSMPPCAVFGKKGLKPQFWISICLTVFLWLPGMIYAYFVILTNLGEEGAIKITTMRPKGGKSDPLSDALANTALEEGTKYANSQGIPTAVTTQVTSNIVGK